MNIQNVLKQICSAFFTNFNAIWFRRRFNVQIVVLSAIDIKNDNAPLSPMLLCFNNKCFIVLLPSKPTDNEIAPNASIRRKKKNYNIYYYC